MYCFLMFFCLSVSPPNMYLSIRPSVRPSVIHSHPQSPWSFFQHQEITKFINSTSTSCSSSYDCVHQFLIYIQSILALRTPHYYGHPPLQTKSSPPSCESYRGLTENDSCYYGLSLLWTPNYVPRVSAVMRADCMRLHCTWLTEK